jgi:hypothetical protein
VGRLIVVLLVHRLPSFWELPLLLFLIKAQVVTSSYSATGFHQLVVGTAGTLWWVSQGLVSLKDTKSRSTDPTNEAGYW